MPKFISVIIIVLVIFGGIMFFRSRGTEPRVLGSETQIDPNHPTEIYYGPTGLYSLAEMTHDLSIDIYPEDKVITLPDPVLGIGSKITINRATVVNVTDAKVKKVYRTWKETVGELLAEKNIELIDKDSAEPVQSTKLENNMNIKITRVAELDITQSEPIQYKVIKKYNNTLEKGNKNILEKGKNGEKSVTYHIKRVDGEEVSRKLTDTKIVSEQTDEIQEIGTWVKVFSNDAVASWYGIWPWKAKAANNAYYAAAHDWGTYPVGTQLWVINKANGKGVKVTVLDYMENPNCTLDLSKAAFSSIASLGAGIIDIRIEKYYPSN